MSAKKISFEDIKTSAIQLAEDYIENIAKSENSEQLAKQMGAMKTVLSYNINKYYIATTYIKLEGKLKTSRHIIKDAKDIKILQDHKSMILKCENALIDLKNEEDKIDDAMRRRGT